MHSKAYCWTSYSSGIYCDQDQICCGSLPNEYCCWSDGEETLPGFVVASVVLGSLFFVICITLSVIRCLCKKQPTPGGIMGVTGVSVHNKPHPTTVYPQRHIVAPQGAVMGGRAAQGQVFISNPQHSGQSYQHHPSYYSSHGSAVPHTGTPTVDNTTRPNIGQHQALPSAPFAQKTTTHYPPQGHPLPSTEPPRYEQVMGTPEGASVCKDNVPPEVALLPGHVPPPFEYNPPSLPPRSQLYNNK
ncbi:cyclin-K-like [Saccostrea echinata]|uniref:cyclin-K-like n=1 Tax=Saccostrea echinata TaxID=191078 RepID=UPI002A7F4B0B|nr:cyclin-K-like [Saccostrea echinata]